MSDPNTDLDTQKKRHFGSLGGIAFGLIVVAVLAVAYLAWGAKEAGDTEQPDPAAEAGTVEQ